MTLVEFLTARLDEDEQAAKLVPQPYRLYVDDDGRISEPKRVEDWDSDRDGEYEQWADGDDRMPNHITNWALIYDPARFLRDVERDRRILEAHKEHDSVPHFCRTCGSTAGPCETKRLLALPYADHPSFKEEWRP